MGPRFPQNHFQRTLIRVALSRLIKADCYTINPQANLPNKLAMENLKTAS
jgi:hypothetical protein